MASFHNFLKSEQFNDAVSSIKHLMAGPPTLQLFDTNAGPKDAASSPVVEIIRTSISESHNVDASLEAWKKLSRHLSCSQIPVAFGKSSNLENEVVAGIIGWQGSMVRSLLPPFSARNAHCHRNTQTVLKRKVFLEH
jgi:hypothetical protein